MAGETPGGRVPSAELYGLPAGARVRGSFKLRRWGIKGSHKKLDGVGPVDNRPSTD